jgi:cobalt/nickel transport system permease protein
MAHRDTYAEVDWSAYTNRLAKCSPITKSFFAFSALILSVSSQSIFVPTIIFVICTTLSLRFAKINVKLYRYMFFYPTILLILGCLIIALFGGSGEPLIELQISWVNWTIFKNRVDMSVNTFFRVEGALSSVFFLVLTTSITDLCILFRRARMPKILVEMSLLIYRYIFVFLEVSEKMEIAQKLRLRSSGWLSRIRSTALLGGNLFIRTLEQGERTFVAMSARGYDGNIHLLEDQPSPNKILLGGIVIFDILMVILLFLTINIGVVT